MTQQDPMVIENLYGEYLLALAERAVELAKKELCDLSLEREDMPGMARDIVIRVIREEVKQGHMGWNPQTKLKSKKIPEQLSQIYDMEEEEATVRFAQTRQKGLELRRVIAAIKKEQTLELQNQLNRLGSELIAELMAPLYSDSLLEQYGTQQHKEKGT